MRAMDRLSTYFFITACLGCVVIQAYLTGFYVAQDELRQKMAYGDWVLTMEVAARGEKK